MARGHNLLSKLYNKPLLITLDDLQPIADYLSSPERVASLKFEKDNTYVPVMEDFSIDAEYQKAIQNHLDINPETMTAVLNVDGVLVNREGQMNSQCVELTSYQGLKKRFEMQVAQGIKSCVLMISSGGGEAYGAWSTASYVKKVAQENNIKLTAYIDGSACSAAYVWAVVADEVISHPMGSSGSIGVLVQLYNDSKMLESLGVERSFVYAGGNKIPFDKKGGFTDKFISDLQSSVDKTYDKFVNHVVQNRGLSEKDVINTQASVFDAEEALQIGLVDKIMELEDFELEYGLKTPKSNYAGFNKMAADNSHNIKEESMPKEKEVTPNDAELLSNAPAKPTNEGSKNMSEVDTQLLELTKENKGLSTQLLEFSEKLKASDDKVVELNGILQEKELAYRIEQRQAKLEEALGKDNEGIEELLKNTESLSDESFAIVAQSLSGSQVKTQEQLSELGGEGQESELQMTLADKMKQTAAAMNASRKA